MTRQFTELFCSHSSLVKVSRPETRQGKCHGYPINKLPQFGGPLHCADGTKQASRVRTYAFITNMTNEDGGSFESTSRCHLWVQSFTICTHVVSLGQTCLQCRYAQGQTLVTVHMRIGTQRTIHCTDYLFIGPEYSKVARGMLYMFTVTDPFSRKHWPINSSDSEGSTALRVFDDYVMLDTARVSVTLCLQKAELLSVV